MHHAKLLVALLVVGGSWATPVITPNDIQDFAAVIPLEKVWIVVSDYLAYDKDVKEMLGYVQTDEFKHMITEIDAMPEFIQFLNSLEDSDYPAYKYWNIIHTVLGMTGLENPSQPAPPPLTGGFTGLVSDVKALVKEDEVTKVYQEKLKSNPRFKTLVDHFQGETFKKVLGKATVLPEVSTMLEKMGLTDLAEHKNEE